MLGMDRMIEKVNPHPSSLLVKYCCYLFLDFHIKKQKKKHVAMKKRHMDAQKMVKDWLRKFKIQISKFNGIFFIDEDHIDKKKFNPKRNSPKLDV